MPTHSRSGARRGTARNPGADPRGGRERSREPLAAKVPEITALFWVIKILTTGMGEATSDFLAQGNLVVAGVAGFAGFAVALWLQFRVRRYSAVVYWLAVAMVAVFGTMAADGLHVGLGIPYLATTIFYAALLALVLYRWHRSEGTLSIHSITTRRRETYYWLTVLATFALGTATGDLTAIDAAPGLPALRHPVHRPHPDPGPGLVAVRPERDRGLLVGLCPHPPAGRLVRRLAQQAPRQLGPGPGRRPGRRGVGGDHRGARRLRRHHP